MTTKLTDILFKDYRKRILGLLLLHPEQLYHVREVARLTGTIAGTTGRELKKLAEAGVLLSARQGNQVTYSANQQCPIYDDLVSILRKTSGLADVLAEALLPLQDKIEAAFVFGSVAKNRANPNSDVDVCIIGEVTYSDVVTALYDAQELLSREVNPKCFSVSEWLTHLKSPGPFIRDLLSKDVIPVIGDRDDIK